MPAKILESKSLSQSIKTSLSKTVHLASEKNIRSPGLAVILIGHNPASEIYVHHKQKACEEVGIRSFCYHLTEEIQNQELIDLIEQLNEDSNIDGILIQLPLPSHIDSAAIIERIKASKDVDGFHPYNLGRLLQSRPNLRPCTPYGIIQLLNHYNMTLSGINAVVVGASNIVGRPMALELLYAKATVSVCHSQTKQLEQYVRQAELLIVATGICDLIKTEWLNESQIVIDVGIHRKSNGQLRGDVDYQVAEKIVAAISPVPGGVGPMTVASLLQNTIKSWQHRLNLA